MISRISHHGAKNLAGLVMDPLTEHADSCCLDHLGWQYSVLPVCMGDAQSGICASLPMLEGALVNNGMAGRGRARLA